jgi:NAD(P)-dependent dehydrogenase (short-subunit alcohol dehydrogenase family)
MKVLVVGASGTIGRAVVQELSSRHEVIQASRSSATHPVDITQPESIAALLKKVGPVDAMVAAVGDIHFGPLREMTGEQFRLGLNSKLMGQVELVLQGQKYLNDGGSFTLTSGIAVDALIRQVVNASAVNCALEGFAKGAALELGRGQRINVVSPTVLTESLPVYGPYFIGFESVPGARVALAYARSVDGAGTGEVFRVW